MGILDKVGFKFDEVMSGYVGIGHKDPEEGEAYGKKQGTILSFDIRVIIDDLGLFLRNPHHKSTFTGTCDFAPIGNKLKIENAKFNFLSLDQKTGVEEMSYEYNITDNDNNRYFVRSRKENFNDPYKFDLVEDMTVATTYIYKGENDEGEIFASGKVKFDLKDSVDFLSSMKVTTKASFWQEAAAKTAFISMYAGAMCGEHFKDLLVTYDTSYENLVIGQDAKDGNTGFFMVSGMHDKGFPWGDGQSFWDLIIAIERPDGGYDRYGITDRMLLGLNLDVTTGKYSYDGPLYKIETGYKASLSGMKKRDKDLSMLNANIEIDFTALSFDTVPVPFPVIGRLLGKISAPVRKKLREIVPSHMPLGMHITPHSVTIKTGEIKITDNNGTTLVDLKIDANDAFGEAERSTFRNIKEPTLLYGYTLGLIPGEKTSRVQIHTRTLRDDKVNWIKDRMDAIAGEVINKVASVEMLTSDNKLKVKKLVRSKINAKKDLFVKLGDPIIELNNDHFPTAIFQRRIIKVTDPCGKECLAMEEDMDLMKCSSIGSDREVTVAAIENKDKKAALYSVIKETGFDETLKTAFEKTNKSKEDFCIVIKPNFMFAYNVNDHSTYTDPELVGYLARHIKDLGFKNISVVESHSTYGEYFDLRTVKDMAEYLGFTDTDTYKIVDMTQDAQTNEHLGAHLGNHPVSKIWKDADFRISFAKNKTHFYASYTLNLKNIYGALPLPNKFKEYHMNRDIYHTAIEYLEAFPVHFGFIDAFLSADGPFGVFADADPAPTRTVIGGEDLVAVDWTGATKMGLDPMISKYMRLAVKAFGKPQINFIGNSNPYHPWLNVDNLGPMFAHNVLDADYYFGNLFYCVCGELDDTRFTHKDTRLHIKILRALTKNFRYAVFVRTNKNPSWLNRLLSKIFYKMGF